MLVEINLLQERDRKNRAFYILLTILLLLIIALIAATYFFTSQIQKDIEAKEKRIETIQQVRTQLLSQSSNSLQADVMQLEANITAIQDNIFDSDQLLKDLTALLPNTGVIQSFQFSDQSINLQIFVEDDMEAVYYYHHLSNQDWISSVNLQSVSSTTVVTDEEEIPSYAAHYYISLDDGLSTEAEGGEENEQEKDE